MIINEKYGIPDNIDKQTEIVYNKLRKRLSKKGLNYFRRLFPKNIKKDYRITLFNVNIDFSNMKLNKVPFNIIFKYKKTIMLPFLYSFNYQNEIIPRYDNIKKKLIMNIS